MRLISPSLKKAAAWAALLSACAAVFLAWRSPHLMLELAGLVRACF